MSERGACLHLILLQAEPDKTGFSARQASNCLAAKHHWDLVSWAIAEYAWRFEPALLHNKVMDSHEESDVIDGRDAQTDTTEVSHDQLVRI